MEDGNCNTKFFHRVANSRRKFNVIKSIVVEGELHVDDSSVKGAILQFYEKLYHENFTSRPFLARISYSSINLEDVGELEKEFSEKEVWKAINDLGKEKATGPDGFNIAFLALLGHCQGGSYGLISRLHKKGTFEKSLNAPFISLFPKVASAVDITKFRPISLVGSVYKILAKVLDPRLRIVIGKAVSPYQHAFITGHQILYAALIANECVHSCPKSNLPTIICKLDMKKAYDHVSWDFLVTILEWGFL